MTATAFASTVIESELLIDTDLDGKSDASFTSNPINQGSDQLRYYQLNDNLARFEWEDLFTGGDGDYNDYLGFFEARRCEGGSTFPPSASFPEGRGINCNQPCNLNGSICWSPPSVTNTTARFVVSVGIDNLNNDIAREDRDRMIHVTVAMYADPSIAGIDFAVCPELHFDWTPDPSEDTQLVSYGRDSSCVDNGNNTGETECTSTTGPETYLPVALAREQHFNTDSCKVSPTGPGDQFLLPGSLACGGLAGLYLQTYEIPLKELDSRLLGTKNDFMSLTWDKIRDRLREVQLNLVEELQTVPFGAFHCPSGVRVRMESVSAAHVALSHMKYVLYNSSPIQTDSNLIIYPRE